MPKRLLYSMCPKAQIRSQYEGLDDVHAGKTPNPAKKPWVVRPQGRCAAWMVTLSCPSIFLVGLLTIPSQLFRISEYERFYFFWKEVDLDPFRWAALALAFVCTALALVMPLLLRQGAERAGVR